MAKKLSAKETEVLTAVMQAVEAQFDEEEGAELDYVEHDDNTVYFDVNYADGEGESMKLNRADLLSDNSPEEIAKEVC